MAPASFNNSVEFLDMHTYLERNYNYHIDLCKGVISPMLKSTNRAPVLQDSRATLCLGKI
jgi:hypothetical protein